MKYENLLIHDKSGLEYNSRTKKERMMVVDEVKQL